jgi:hypothetical protein
VLVELGVVEQRYRALLEGLLGRQPDPPHRPTDLTIV